MIGELSSFSNALGNALTNTLGGKSTQQSTWRKFALLSGAFEIIANLFFMLAINNLELSKVGIFMASAPARSVLIAIKLLHQKPSLVNWAGIAATSGALALIAVG